MTDLSPQAQAVFDAFRADWKDEQLKQDVKCLAAALRAAANYVPDHQMSAHMLHAIADELDGTNTSANN